MRRKIPLVTNEVYHIFSRSIAYFVILNSPAEYLRLKQLLKYYQIETELRFSDFVELRTITHNGFNTQFEKIAQNKERYVQIVGYCLMPTHLHLILKQLKENGISIYCGNVLNSYSRYFNIKHRRQGPLWEAKFKNVLISSDEQLLHLTRYIHLNPVIASLVKKPEQWPHSSYKEYIGSNEEFKICSYENLLKIDASYKKFVNDQIGYQKGLGKIKSLLLDD